MEAKEILRHSKKPESLGVVETQVFRFGNNPEHDSLLLENGEKLFPVDIAYETYGTLNDQKNNAILITHAFSGDAHAAGYHVGDTKPGWWDKMIGPGKPFDTDKYFVIASNVIGGCMGSTGPASINPETGRRYGLSFPQITIADMVNAQERLITHLGIEKLLAVAGGSMGGMQVLQWMASYPNRIHSAIPIATTAKHSPQQIAFNEVGRQAIMADINWNGGDYYRHEPPARGLSVARMVGHITYMSDISMSDKFGRRRKDGVPEKKFTPVFEVEGYLKYNGDSFVQRFDPNSYLYITKAMDLFDLAGEGSLASVFTGINVKVLVLSYKSDWLYPTYQSKEIVKACKIAGLEITYVEVDSTYGHDAFLLETERQGVLLSHFLGKLSEEIQSGGEIE